MKRDWNLIKEILEEGEQGFAESDFPVPGSDREGHFVILFDGGYLTGDKTTPDFRPRLTWDGYDLLDHLREFQPADCFDELIKDKVMEAVNLTMKRHGSPGRLVKRSKS